MLLYLVQSLIILVMEESPSIVERVKLQLSNYTIALAVLLIPQIEEVHKTV